MNVESFLNLLYDTLRTYRGLGSTSLLREFSEADRAWVLTADENAAKAFGKKAINVNTLPQSLAGRTRLPVLVENHVIMVALQVALQRLHELKTDEEEATKMADQLADRLNQAIDTITRFERAQLVSDLAHMRAAKEIKRLDAQLLQAKAKNKKIIRTIKVRKH